MPRTRFLAPVLTLALAACGSELPSDPLAVLDAAQFSQVGHDRPFKAECNLRIQPPTVLSPGVIRQIDAGDCQALHLGTSTLVSDKVINLAAGTQTTQITFTAANGDLLHAAGTGTNVMVAPGIVQFTADMTFAGGTGRFAHASGRATIRGQANLAEARSATVMEGFILY
ncbi:MAG TPA: hypothetical protein VGD27_09685 [Longimicrobiales bacterium]